MTTQRAIIAISTGAVLVGLATGVALGRQSAEADVRELHATYYQYFADGQAGEIAQRIYHPNRMAFGQNGVAISSGRDEVESGFRRALEGLAAERYDHSEMPDPSICTPNPGTAIVSGMFRRYREDGSVLAELGQTYIYGQTDDGWRIHATIAHGPETVIGCLE
jgi:hypothetical protein|tara:strand:+ start:839 stop:1330 length:492 start_codon:yes stop_codon:yes gene_type:complete